MRKRHGMDTLRKVLTDPALSAAYQDANKTGRKPPHRTLAGMLWNSLNLAKRQNPTAVRRRLLQFKERFGRGVTVRMSEDSRFREFQGLQPEHNLALPLVKLSQAQKEEIIATWRRNTDVAATARLRSTNEIPLNAGDVKQVLVQAGVYKPKTRRDPNAAYWASLTEPQIGQLVKKHGLYPAEERVLLELAAGGNPYEIANRLGTSMDGFRQAKLRLRRKLGLGRVRPTKK